MKLINADCIAAMKEMPDNSVDSIVTDPPYELGFMGKSWDSTGIAFNVEVWQEALRVLKPGGHLIAFSGSRTYHRMAVAIEDAGFEIRDQIMWVYGSGFPKSLDISKAIDKSSGENRARQLQFTAWMRESGLSQKDCAKAIRQFAKNDETAAAMAQHYYSDKQQPAIATADLFDALRPYLPEVPEEIERLVAERTGIEWTAYKNRQVTGQYENAAPAAIWMDNYDLPADLTPKEKKDIPFTPEAQQWDGWGTALKPAHEPMVLARKPVVGTVANNVLTYGVGGLNIDGSRVEGKLEGDPNRFAKTDGGWAVANLEDAPVVRSEGRWPANFIHDGLDTEWAKFFYCAKTSKRDRNEGLDGFEAKRDHDGRVEGKVGGSNPRNRTNAAKVNHHPTVKPTSLMQYLVRLVTPQGGTVLDPFMGSGSTGKACAYEGFDFIGIDQSAEYVEIARARINFALENLDVDI